MVRQDGVGGRDHARSARRHCDEMLYGRNAVNRARLSERLALRRVARLVALVELRFAVLMLAFALLEAAAGAWIASAVALATLSTWATVAALTTLALTQTLATVAISVAAPAPVAVSAAATITAALLAALENGFDGRHKAATVALLALKDVLDDLTGAARGHFVGFAVLG